ncbi:hypothetical protein DdX_14319 [Ditylenchus destructor]|uniref:Uncharacterized protein n=1 Tax=Ditylenchus destructor TaxID=166010 RepID=A0AAD4MX12_9BILA|nr:hypothetical protein DdX_14319 [Ditylenchus destructor]
MLGLRSLRSLRPRRENQYWVGFVKITAAFGGLDFTGSERRFAPLSDAGGCTGLLHSLDTVQRRDVRQRERPTLALYWPDSKQSSSICREFKITDKISSARTYVVVWYNFYVFTADMASPVQFLLKRALSNVSKTANS